jgi:hypothetical protein
MLNPENDRRCVKIPSKYVEIAEKELEKGDKVDKSYTGRLDGEFGHLLMSNENLMFVTEKGFLSKKYKLVQKIPFADIDKLSQVGGYELEFSDETGKKFDFKPDIPANTIVNEIKKRLH